MKLMGSILAGDKGFFNDGDDDNNKNSPECPSANEWIQKLWYIYTMEFYTSERKKELIPFATPWMELESIMLSEISQAVRDKYHMISPISGT